MLRRVQRFLIDHARELGSINQSAARKELDALVVAMFESAEAAVTTRAMGTGESANARALRRELRMSHMRQIAAVARAELAHVPEFEALRLPPTGESTPRLVERARAMAAVAREHAPVFFEHQLPADFADQLLAAADTLEASVRKRAVNGRDAAGAQEQLAAIRSRAHLVVRVLSTQVEKAVAGDATLLGQWAFAKRVGLPRPRAEATDAQVQAQ